MQNLPNLTQQVVRDLAWAIFAPSLIDNYSFHPGTEGVESYRPLLTPARREWLIQLDRDPRSLLEVTRALKSTRLGVYFEALWRFFVNADPGLGLIANNLPVYKNGQTFGEFDLLFHDNDKNEAVHLELATKYYLDTGHCVRDAADFIAVHFSNWLGPNGKDRLDLKLKHLLCHQIKLSESPPGLQALGQYPISNIRKAIALKGFLFYRTSGNTSAERSDFPLNPDHSRGAWLPYREIIQRADCAEYWHILQRPRWLSSARLESDRTDRDTMTPRALGARLTTLLSQKASLPVMLCAMQARNGILIETDRYMITGSDWPPDQDSD